MTGRRRFRAINRGLNQFHSQGDNEIEGSTAPPPTHPFDRKETDAATSAVSTIRNGVDDDVIRRRRRKKKEFEIVTSINVKQSSIELNHHGNRGATRKEKRGVA